MNTLTRRALVVAGAALAPAAIWLVAHAAGVRPEVAFAGQPWTPVDLPAAVIFAAVGSLAGWAALAVLERLTRHGRALWTLLAALVLLGSLVPPLAVQASVATRLTLVAMHLAVGLVLVPGLLGAVRARAVVPA